MLNKSHALPIFFVSLYLVMCILRLNLNAKRDFASEREKIDEQEITVLTEFLWFHEHTSEKCLPPFFSLHYTGYHEISARLSILASINSIHHKGLAPKRLRERRFVHLNFTSTSR